MLYTTYVLGKGVSPCATINSLSLTLLWVVSAVDGGDVEIRAVVLEKGRREKEKERMEEWRNGGRE